MERKALGATTNAVVTASILILIFNYLLTQVFLLMTIRNKIEMEMYFKSFGTKHVLQTINLDIPVGSSMVPLRFRNRKIGDAQMCVGF